MADASLRDLERNWQATSDPILGLRLILAKFRAGLLVDLADFPLELWHQIVADYGIENLAHHTSLGGERLDRQLMFWLRFVDRLPRLGTSFSNLVGNSFSTDNLLIISDAATRQQCKTSIVYYPTLPPDKRVALYINMLLTPETLSPAFMQLMREGEPEDVTHWGLVMKAFFDPAGSPNPSHLDMAVLLDASPFEPDPNSWVIKVLNGVSTIYDMPADPPPTNLGYRFPYLVLKELS